MNTLRYDNNINQDSELPHTDPLVYNFNCSDTIDLHRMATQKPQLKLNNVGKAVLELQQMLQMLQYLKKGNADGFFGQGTMEAVKKFQIIYHLSVDGIVGKKTWEALEKAIKSPKRTLHHTLRVGDENENVKELQNKLKSLGYFHQCVSGTFCEETQSRVKQFQESNNLNTDGVVGKKTWQVLDALFLSSDISMNTLEEPVSRGVFGEPVKVLQRNLKTLGCYNGEVNGHFGVETTSAVKQFQSMYRMPQTGTVDQDTWQTMIETIYKSNGESGEKEGQLQANINSERSISPQRPTLQIGDVGEAVSEAQNKLSKLLYYKGAMDSIFDTTTKSAVQAFQTKYNLKADGIIGSQTWSVLNSIADKYPTTVDHHTINTKGKIVSSDTKEQSHFMYIVQPGDYLSKVANTYETTVEEIEELNHLRSDFLFVGQQLKIPNTIIE